MPNRPSDPNQPSSSNNSAERTSAAQSEHYTVAPSDRPASAQQTPVFHVLIIDDDTRLRKSLLRALAHRGCIGHQAASVDEGTALLERHPIDLVFLDLFMPGTPGLVGLAAIHQRWPHMPVVIITGHASLDAAIEAMRHGARDMLLKPLNPDLVIDTMVRILDAQVTPITHPPPAADDEAIRSFQKAVRAASARAVRAWELTDRQSQVLLLLMMGKGNKEVAAELGCAERTVEDHIGAVLRKSGARDSRSLVAACMSRFWSEDIVGR